MAQHKSAKKRIRVTAKKNTRNSQHMSSVRTAIKKFRTALETANKDANVQELFKNAQAALAKAATKGMIHKNNVSRKVSRLAQLLKQVESGKKIEPAVKKKTSAKKKTTAAVKKAAAVKKSGGATAASKKPAAKKTAKKK